MQLIENLNSVSTNTKKKLKYRTIQNIINLKTVNISNNLTINLTDF